VVRAYRAACTTVINRYEGHVAQHLGDGLLAYFGYPVAHEDDAQRAVRTGLEIVEAIPPLSFPRHVRLPQSLQVRIGIHTGPVVIGEIGGGAKRELLALGETPNVAARAQGEAEPNTVVMSAATAHLVEGLFACQTRSADAKGYLDPVIIVPHRAREWRQSRFEAAVRTGLTPLVGREENRVCCGGTGSEQEGAGQVVLLSGEAGTQVPFGRSQDQVAGGRDPIELRCSPISK
jgi:class 3 adenylate cyclase